MVLQDGSPVSEEVKTMMFHMKKDLESEIERLRKHMEKEKSRCVGEALFPLQRYLLYWYIV